MGQSWAVSECFGTRYGLSDGLRFNHSVDTTNLVCMGVMRSTSDQPPALTNQTSPSVDSDYDSIHAAVMETVRGRWFLSEYARRNRHAETDVLLKAIGRIESFIEDQVQDQLPEPLSAPFSRASSDSQQALPDVAPAVEPLFAPKDRLDSSCADLALVRERLRDITDSLIECGAPSFLTNDLKRRLDDIASICLRLEEIAAVAQPVADGVVAMEGNASVQGEPAQAVAAEIVTPEVMAAEVVSADVVAADVVAADVVEADVASAAALGSAVQQEVLEQEIFIEEIAVQEITVMASRDEAPCAAVVSEPEPEALPEPQVRRDPFADIRALSAIEKIALFT